MESVDVLSWDYQAHALLFTLAASLVFLSIMMTYKYIVKPMLNGHAGAKGKVVARRLDGFGKGVAVGINVTFDAITSVLLLPAKLFKKVTGKNETK